MSLPNDLLREIFSYLDLKIRLQLVPRISKQWDYESAFLLGSPLEFSSSELCFHYGLRPLNANTYARAVNRSFFSHVTSVIFTRAHETDPTVIRALLENCPNITYFGFNTIGFNNPLELLTPWPGSDIAPKISSIKFFRTQILSTDFIESITKVT